jgi:hypothetical protein
MTTEHGGEQVPCPGGNVRPQTGQEGTRFASVEGSVGGD